MALPWKRRLRPARFRGKTFNVDESSRTGGRRGLTHEFPDRDIPFREDLGRKAKVYNIEGFIVGPNYISNKNKLIDALETKGPGELIHPYYGRVRVSVDSFTVQESTRDGGFVKFSMTFVESGEVKFPKAGSDSGFLIDSASSALDSSSQGAFSSVFSTLDQAAYAVDSVTEKVNDFADQLDDILSKLNGPAGAVADLALAIRNLKSVAADLVTRPVSLAQEMASAFSMLLDAGDPIDVLREVKKTYSFGSNDVAVPTTTASRVKQSNNLKALNNFVKTQSAVVSSKAASQATYTTTQDAETSRAIVTDHIDSLMDSLPSESPEDDENFSALQQLRAELVKGVPSKTDNLANVTEIELKSTDNILSLCHDLYGSLELEDDIVSRNNIKNPAFVTPSKKVEVLDRG